MDRSPLAEQVVSFLVANLTGRLPRVVGSEIEQQYSMIAGYLRKDPFGGTAIAQLEQAPHDQRVRRQVTVIVSELLAQDDVFAGVVGRVLRDVSAQHGSVTNSITGAVSGHAVQAGAIHGGVDLSTTNSKVRKVRRINTGGIVLLIALLVLGVGGAVTYIVLN